MIDKIIAQLKTGTIKNVVPFGYGSRPAPPYIVVSQMTDPIGRGIVYRIHVHMMPGQNLDLMDYTIEDISTLLDGFEATTRHANTNTIERGDINYRILSNDDETISMSRDYLMPSIAF